MIGSTSFAGVVSSSGLRIKMESKEGAKFFFRLGISIGRALEGSFLLGYDTRPSSEPFGQALASGLNSVGMPVTVCGVLPVAAVSYLVVNRKADFGLMVTASHNPPEWNGLKLFGPSGIIADESVISSAVEKAIAIDTPPEIARFEHAEDMQETYVQGLRNEFRQLGVTAEGLRIAVDPGNGALSDLSISVLEMIGADVLAINCEMDGVFHRAIEPNAETLFGLSSLVRDQNCDLGVGYDCDGDRAVLVGPKGMVLREDMTLLASLLFLLKRVRSSFVVSNASSSAFTDLARNTGRRVYVSKVGERNVAMRMRKTGSLLGGEGSCGGVIFSDLAMTRDGLLATASSASLLAGGASISEALGPYTKYHASRFDIPFDRPSIDERRLFSSLKATFPGVKSDEWDGLKFQEADGWVLVRPSKTEPVVRVIAEALEAERAKSLATKYATALRRILS